MALLGGSYGSTGGGGGGTVTSVGLAGPAEVVISGSPVTGAGTLSFDWVSQLQNLIFASPNGSSGLPTFRAIAYGDLPGGGAPATLPVGTPVTGAGTDEILFIDSGGAVAVNPNLVFRTASNSFSTAHPYVVPVTGVLTMDIGSGYIGSPAIVFRQFDVSANYDTVLTVGDSQGLYSGTPNGFRAMLQDLTNNIRDYIEIAPHYTSMGVSDFNTGYVQSFSTNYSSGISTWGVSGASGEHSISLSDAFKIQIKTPALTYLWPEVAPGSTLALLSDVLGNLTWGTPTVPVTGTANEVAYFNGSGNLSSDFGFTRQANTQTQIIFDNSPFQYAFDMGPILGSEMFSFRVINTNDPMTMGFGNTSGIGGAANSWYTLIQDTVAGDNSNMYMDATDWEVTLSNHLSEQSGFQAGTVAGASFISMTNFDGVNMRRIRLDSTGIRIGNPSGTMFAWMTADGTAGQAIVTDASGNLSFASFLSLTGGTMTGTLTLDPLSQINPNDAATIGQLAAFVSGLSWKSPPVDAASTGNINLLAPGATMDGYSFVTAGVDTFLAKDQILIPDNGIYVWNGAAVPATRRTDADAPSELNAATIGVVNGTQAGKAFTQITPNPTIGVSNIIWTSVGNSYLNGAGISLTGNVFSIATGGIINSMVNAAAAIDGTKIVSLFGAQPVVSTSGLSSFQQIDITGTAGAGFIHFGTQSAAPSQPAIGTFTMYSTNNGRTAIRSGNSGVNGIGVLDFSQLGASRNFEFPNTSGIVALVPGANQFVSTNGGTLSSFAAVDLASMVTGVLPIANGGTNNSGAYSNTAVIFSNGTALIGDVTKFNYTTATGLLQANAFWSRGTAGQGYFRLDNQTSNPPTPSGGILIYSDNAGRYNFLNSSGRPISLDTSLLSAGRVQQFPDANGVFGLVPTAGIVLSNGSILSSTTFPTAGVVTSTGAAFSSYVRQVLRVTATQSVATTTPTALTQLTSTSLVAGTYKFTALLIFQSTAAATGVGFRMNPGTATMSSVYGQFLVGQGADGLNKLFAIDQLAVGTNVTTASVVTVNTDATATVTGTFTLSVGGTVNMQMRSETGTAVSIRSGSWLEIEGI